MFIYPAPTSKMYFINVHGADVFFRKKICITGHVYSDAMWKALFLCWKCNMDTLSLAVMYSCPYELDIAHTGSRFLCCTEALILSSQRLAPRREAINEAHNSELPNAGGSIVLNKPDQTGPFQEGEMALRQPFSWAAPDRTPADPLAARW
jgi:hypothetical protein